MPDPTPLVAPKPLGVGGSPPEWSWTAKLPALLVGLGFVIAGLYVSGGRATRAGVLIGSALVIAGALLLVYSSTVAGWCSPPNRAFGKLEWASGLWHEPALADCWRLTR